MPKQHTASSEAGFLLTGVVSWLLSSLLLALLSAAVVYVAEPEEASLGYFVSAITFQSAAVAGFLSAKRRKKAAIYAGLIVGCAVICFALMLGFLIAGNRLTADSILSLVTFTLAGCVAGCILPTEKEKKTRKKIFFPGKRA